MSRTALAAEPPAPGAPSPSRVPRGRYRPRTGGRPQGRARDTQLCQVVRDGDTSAFEELWRRHHQALVTGARYLCQSSRADADDLAAETMLTAYRALRSGHGPRDNVGLLPAGEPAPGVRPAPDPPRARSPRGRSVGRRSGMACRRPMGQGLRTRRRDARAPVSAPAATPGGQLDGHRRNWGDGNRTPTRAESRGRSFAGLPGPRGAAHALRTTPRCTRGAAL